MNPDDAARVAELFEQAIDLPPAERAALLGAACQGCPALRAEVEALLAADAAAAAAPGLYLAATAAPPAHIGPYRIDRLLGSGGMSEVWLGVREDGEIERRVAIKLLRRELATPELVRRFETERQVLASLEHPAIARLYDAGHTRDGRPYFVMEMVEGVPIDTYCERHQLSIPERLGLLIEVCGAVHFAHQNLIVHRDVKPGNVLVTTGGEPRLLDFGIAKLLNPGLVSGAREPTRAWERLMTPDYASPEQLLGRTVTAASDVYSLGVLLYKLLTGALPFSREERESLVGTRFADPCAPPPPSQRVPAGLARQLAGNLDAVVLRALAPEPRHRYGSAAHLAADLGRHLGGERVAARGGSGIGRARRPLGSYHTALTVTGAAASSFLAALLALPLIAPHLFGDDPRSGRLRPAAATPHSPTAANGLAPLCSPIQVAGATCAPVEEAYISHFTGRDCRGEEHYYTAYNFYDGVRRSWDGKGCATSTLRTVTHRSYKDASGTCYNAWPDGHTLNDFVAVNRPLPCVCEEESSCAPVEGAHLSSFTGPACTGEEHYDTSSFNDDGLRRSWDGQGCVGRIRRSATIRSTRDWRGICQALGPAGLASSDLVKVYRY